MRIVFAIILLSAMLVSCRRKVFHYTSLDPAINNNMQRLEIDDTYKFYVRQVTEKPHPVTQENKLYGTETAGNWEDLIEVEYLFISEPYKKLIYISTMPDKYKQRYRNYYLGSRFVNAFDFKTFLFGEIEADGKIKFTDFKGVRTDYWKISYDNDRVYINDVIEKVDNIFDNNMPVDEALKNPVYFFYVKDPLLVLRRNGEPTAPVPLADNIIYLLVKGRKCKLYLQFDGEIKKGRTTIYFDDDRIVYDPRHIFK